MSTEDLIEFLQDTEPDWYVKPSENFILKPLEVHEVPKTLDPNYCKLCKTLNL